MESKYQVGQLVEHPLKPEWGPGKVVDVVNHIVHVFFRDYSTNMATPISSNHIDLKILPDLHDDILDNLPSFKETPERKWHLCHERKMTISDAEKKFLGYFPQGFSDPEYLGDENEGERNYKVWAHDQFQDQLGNGQARQLFEDGSIVELTKRALAVEGKVNLLSVFEKIAFRDALQDQDAAYGYFGRLLPLLECNEDEKEWLLEEYFLGVKGLPRKTDGTRVATWPIATLLPFLAEPTKYIFLKPDVTKKAAEELGFDLHYESTPNIITYQALEKMSEIYLRKLAHLGPKDFIDVQSFFYVTSAKEYS